MKKNKNKPGRGFCGGDATLGSGLAGAPLPAAGRGFDGGPPDILFRERFKKKGAKKKKTTTTLWFSKESKRKNDTHKKKKNELQNAKSTFAVIYPKCMFDYGN